MSPRVTAIIVARNGAQHLPRTLEALAAQTLAPDAVIAVDCGSTDSSADLLASAGPTHLISVGEALPFGAAIAAGVRLTPPSTSNGDLLWLLAQDSAPEPGALAALVAALETAPSVAIAGPKVVDWDRGDIIRSLGESMTSLGATVPLVADELDQGQHDVLSDVLAVAAGGMLVRQTVWDALGGFDPGLPVVDDALDFSVRTRLAGHRVSVAPAARVATAGDGVAGAEVSRTGRIRRRKARLQRTAQLHRRLVYAPALAVPFHWLSLVPLAILRGLLALLGKQPGRIGGELAAAFSAAFSGIHTSMARRRIARTRTLGWSAIAPLRIAPAEMRRRRALAREARIARARGSREEIGFLTTGGAWTVLAAMVVGLVVVSPLLGAGALSGGGILPLSGSPLELWRNTGYGWRDIGSGFVGAADPFAVVLAVLGSLAFWSPSAMLPVLWLTAVPLAALGAWFAAARLTAKGSLRAIAAVLWMLTPSFLSAIAEGRPAPLIAHLLLPWLVFAAFAAARSWAASATAALLLAAVVACAPSLAPALVLAWFVVLVTSGRGFFRIIGIPIPAAVLAAPLVWDQALRGAWLALLADPGVPQPAPTASVWQLLLGFPGGGFGGWDEAIGILPITGLTPALLLTALLAPLAVLALVALFLPGMRRAAASLGLALLGFGTALAATLIAVATTGSELVAVWAGAGLSLYALGVIGAIITGLDAIPRFALIPGIAATLLFVLAAAPLALALPLGSAAVQASSGRILPAFVTAAADTDARAGTLAIVPQPDGGILANLERGAGTTLDDQATLAATDQGQSAEQVELATLAGNLASRSGADAAPALDERRIRFVLLAPAAQAPGAAVTAEAAQTERRATVALNGNAVLVPVGTTDFGTLWRVDTDPAGAAAAAIPARAGGWLGTATTISLIVVFGAAILLSFPTGVGREPRPESEARKARRAPRDGAATGTGSEDMSDDAVDEATEAPADASADAAAEAPADSAEPASAQTVTAGSGSHEPREARTTPDHDSTTALEARNVD